MHLKSRNLGNSQIFQNEQSVEQSIEYPMTSGRQLVKPNSRNSVIRNTNFDTYNPAYTEDVGFENGAREKDAITDKSLTDSFVAQS